MRRTLAVAAILVGATAARPAHAAPPPLRIAWTQKATCPAETTPAAATATTAAWTRGPKLELRALATGVLAKPISLGGSQPDVIALTDDLALVGDTTGVAAYDAKSGKQLWRAAAKHAYAQIAALAPHGDQVAYVTAGELVLVDAHTGARTWSVKLDKKQAKQRDVAGVSDQLVVVADAAAVTAYARKDGAQVWTTPVSDTPSPQPRRGVVDGSGVIVAREHGIAWFDAHGTSASLAFDVPSLDVATATRVYVVTVGSPATLAAVDRGSHAAAWSLQPGGHVAATTPKAVYASDGAGQLVALDPATGKRLAAIGIGTARLMVASAGMIVACGNGKLYGIATDGADAPAETATITGTLACASCGDDPVWLVAGDAKVKAAPNGPFSVPVTARGVVQLRVLFDENADAGDQEQLGEVALTGAKTYSLGARKIERPTQGD